MPRYRLFWPLLAVLGGIMPLGAVDAQPVPNKELTLELVERVGRLEAEVRHLRGQLEIQRYRIEQIQQQRALPAPVPPSSPAAEGQPEMVQPPASSVQTPRSPALSVQPAATDSVTTQPAEPASARTEQADFDAALGELREGRYDEAATRFQRFLAAYPNGALVGDAQYWLGESHYFSQNYSAAKQAFIDLGLHYPQSARLPDALLKLGYIYGQQGDTERAREVFEKLLQVYPGTQAASLAERRLQMLP
ncbi:MAG: tol-pal system protein YbgF [Candidatus Competibacter denitrificans]